MERHVAVWQCSRCADVRSMSLPSYWTFYRQHLCYGSMPQRYTPDGIGILDAGIYQPLNELARAIDASEAERKAREFQRRAEEKEMLAAWPPAPCDRWTWEARC